MIKGKTRTNQPITELSGVGAKMYKHEVYLSLKTSSLTLFGYFNIVSTDSKQITGSLDSSNYFVIDFNTLNIIGIIGGGSNNTLQYVTTTGQQYVIQLVPWGGTKVRFSSEKVKSYIGSGYFGSEAFTECSLIDSVTPL